MVITNFLTDIFPNIDIKIKAGIMAFMLFLFGLSLAKFAKVQIAKRTKKYRWHEELRALCSKGIFWMLFIGFTVFSLLIIASEIFGMDVTLIKKYSAVIASGILKASAILVLGNYLIKVFLKVLAQILKISKISQTLHPFICSSTRIFMLILLGMISLEALGIPTASLLAALASAGLAISLSIKDHLSNLIGGVVILFAHPFKVNDLVEIEGTEGVVSEIGLIYTVLKTYDNRTVLIPNNDTAKAKIVNHTAENLRRVDLTFTIGYNDDYERARQLILRCAEDTGLCLKSPPPFVRMKDHGSSSIEIICRLWTQWEDYFELSAQMKERVKKAFDENSINIPYNQMDIHIIENKAN